MMPTIYERWIWEICLRFGNNLSKSDNLLILTVQNWMFPPIYRKSTALECKYFCVVMELLHNAHPIREMDLGDLPQIWK